MPLFRVTFTAEVEYTIEAVSLAEAKTACEKCAKQHRTDEIFDDVEFDAHLRELRHGGEPDMGAHEGDLLEISDYRAAMNEGGDNG